jgi:ABC-type Fe3+ transport system permease subunit
VVRHEGEKSDEAFFNATALLLLFCCSITVAVRRWLKTQAAAEMRAANEAMQLRRRRDFILLLIYKFLPRHCLSRNTFFRE